MSIIRVASTDSLTVFDLVMLVEINDRTGINATDKTIITSLSDPFWPST